MEGTMIIIIWKIIVIIGIIIPINQWKAFRYEVDFLDQIENPTTQVTYLVPTTNNRSRQVEVTVKYPKLLVEDRNYEIEIDIQEYDNKDELQLELMFPSDTNLDPILVDFGNKKSLHQTVRFKYESGSEVSKIAFQPKIEYQNVVFKYEKMREIQVFKEEDLTAANRNKWISLLKFILFLVIWVILLIWV